MLHTVNFMVINLPYPAVVGEVRSGFLEGVHYHQRILAMIILITSINGQIYWNKPHSVTQSASIAVIGEIKRGLLAGVPHH